MRNLTDDLGDRTIPEKNLTPVPNIKPKFQRSLPGERATDDEVRLLKKRVNRVFRAIRPYWPEAMQHEQKILASSAFTLMSSPRFENVVNNVKQDIPVLEHGDEIFEALKPLLGLLLCDLFPYEYVRDGNKQIRVNSGAKPRTSRENWADAWRYYRRHRDSEGIREIYPMIHPEDIPAHVRRKMGLQAHHYRLH